MSASTSKSVLPFVLLVALLVALALSISSAGPASASPDGPTPHDPIYIVGDDNFTSANGVTSGSGTADDPYIIEDWVIDAWGADRIRIENTTKHFVIRNCLVKNGRFGFSGIYLFNVVNGKIENNTCQNNLVGIWLNSSSNNTLSNNTCENNFYHFGNYGIWLWGSDNNSISNNTCENNYHGIRLDSSSSNTLSNNTCDNNRYNFGVGGDEISHFDHDIDTSNLVDGRPIYYLKDNSDIVIGPSLNAGYLGLVGCDNIRVENLVLGNNGQGILLAFTENSHIDNNTCENNSIGIVLATSSSNILTNNTCENSYSYGIFLWYSSNNTISNNTCENNVFLYGILLGFSDNNTISNNTCENNSTGILLGSSSNNTLSNNTCENNRYGILLDLSSNNTIFHNYLLNNTENNAYDDNTNFWDENGEGNYWDDWQPPEHPDADGDGIVDEPRPIAGGTNQDDYPLVIPSKPFPWALMIGLIVTIIIIITAGIVIYRRH